MYYDGQWHRISDLYMGQITMTPQAHNSGSVSVDSAKSYISVTKDGGSPSYVTAFPANIQVNSQVTVIQGDVLVFSCSGNQLQSITFSGMIPLLNFQCASCGLT